jgi:hypothetical protein
MTEEDIFGDVFVFDAVASDRAVGGAQVAWFPGYVERAENDGSVLEELQAFGGVDRIRAHRIFRADRMWQINHHLQHPERI